MPTSNKYMPDKKQYVPGVVKAFEEFALFVKNKWRATILAIITLALLGGIFLMLYYGYRKIELLGTEVTRSTEILEETHISVDQLQEDFENSVEENRLIEQEMTKCVFKHDIEAMIVFKFHNSRTDLQGKHDFFYSATNEVSQGGVNSYLPDAQVVPIIRLGKYITPMIEGKCQIVHVETMAENDWLRGKLEISGIQTLISCPIYDSEAHLLGFTEIVYTARNPAPIGEEAFVQILHDFKEVTHRISLITQK